MGACWFWICVAMLSLWLPHVSHKRFYVQPWWKLSFHTGSGEVKQLSEAFKRALPLLGLARYHAHAKDHWLRACVCVCVEDCGTWWLHGRPGWWRLWGRYTEETWQRQGKGRSCLYFSIIAQYRKYVQSATYAIYYILKCYSRSYDHVTSADLLILAFVCV